LLAHLGRAESLGEAIAKARIHVNAGGAIRLEEGLMELATDLTSRGETVERSPISFSAVTGIAIDRSETGPSFAPVFDIRKGGAVSVEKAPANVTE
jgi:gamma-glutamyltranspeptidase